MQIEPNPQEEIRTELKFDSGKTLIVLFISKMLIKVILRWWNVMVGIC